MKEICTGKIDTYIYHLVDPHSSEVRYVGKTINPEQRYIEHIRDKTETWRGRWIRKLLSQDLKPTMKIVEVVVGSNNWAAREKWWIAEMKNRGCRLTNYTDGGEGTYGMQFSPETIEKMRRSKLGKYLGKDNPMYGRAHTKEARERIGKASRSRICSEETREKHRQLMLGNQYNRGRDFGDEFREKMSKITRGELNGSSKLTAEEVAGIRISYSDGVSTASLAGIFNISRSQIYRIIRGHSWKNPE